MKNITALNTQHAQNISALQVKKIFDANSEIVKRFEAFLTLKRKVSKYTVKSYLSGINTFCEFLSSTGITNTAELHSNVVFAFRDTLEADKKAPATIALYLSAIRRFFAWLESENLCRNITHGVNAPRLDKGHKRDFLNAGQIQSVMGGISRNSLEGKRDFAIFAIMSTCGLRTIEVVRANVEDLQTLGGNPVLYVQGKGRSEKKEFVKLTEPVIAALRDYFKARGQVLKSDPLFASCSRRNEGGRLSTRSISRICKNSMRRAGLDNPRLTAHSLRHSAVTLALMGGESLSEVQYFARHSSINTTQIYAHNVDRIKSHCENTITNAIFYPRAPRKDFSRYKNLCFTL